MQATEADVEAALVDTLRTTRGLVVVLASAQNVDRLVTGYRAARRAGRRLAVDLHRGGGGSHRQGDHPADRP